jgi:hypothetical protein
MDMHSPPHQPGLILPSWWNVRQKEAVATLCVLCVYARKRPLPLCVYSVCTPESGRCHSVCTLCEPIPTNTVLAPPQKVIATSCSARRRRREHSPKIKWPNHLTQKWKSKKSQEKTKCQVFLFLFLKLHYMYGYVHTIVQLFKEACKLHWVKMHPCAEQIYWGGVPGGRFKPGIENVSKKT